MAKGFGSRGIPGMGGGMNMNMIKQAQKMQQDMLKMQQELEEKTYEASGGVRPLVPAPGLGAVSLVQRGVAIARHPDVVLVEMAALGAGFWDFFFFHNHQPPCTIIHHYV